MCKKNCIFAEMFPRKWFLSAENMMDVESSRLVAVSCADYSQYVAIALRNLFDSRRGADFDFKWEGMSIRAHRVILEMFLATETLGCSVQDPVCLKQEVTDYDDTVDNVLESMLEFLYKGEVTVQEEILEELVRGSKELDLKMFEGAAVEYCYSKVESELNINGDNFLNCSEGSRFVTASCGNYGQYIAIALKNLFDSRRGTDFDLNWEGYTVRAHRIILELFLSTDTMDCNVGLRHEHSDIKHEVLDGDCVGGNNVLESLLEFLYKGEVTVPEEQLGDLLRASKDLDFKMLEDAIVQSCIFKDVNVEKDVLNSEEEDFSSAEKIDDHGKDDFPTTLGGASSNKITSPGVSNLHKCKQCEFETFVALNYRRHLLATHGINTKGEPAPKHKCPHCKYETFVTSNYGRHLSITHGINSKGGPTPKHKCLHCKYETLVDSNYRRHLATTHGISAEGKPRPGHKCPHCEFETFVGRCYIRHLAQNHGILVHKLKCPDCKYETLVATNYWKHLMNKHGIEGTPRPKHKCPHCEFETVIAEYYSRHLAHAHGIYEHKCPHCKYETLIATNYRKHLMNKHGINAKGEPRPKHKCQHCEFETFITGKFRRHLATTHGITSKDEPAPRLK